MGSRVGRVQQADSAASTEAPSMITGLTAGTALRARVGTVQCGVLTKEGTAADPRPLVMMTAPAVAVAAAAAVGSRAATTGGMADAVR